MLINENTFVILQVFKRSQGFASCFTANSSLTFLKIEVIGWCFNF